jgi:hypothetical protein
VEAGRELKVEMKMEPMVIIMVAFTAIIPVNV